MTFVALAVAVLAVAAAIAAAVLHLDEASRGLSLDERLLELARKETRTNVT